MALGTDVGETASQTGHTAIENSNENSPSTAPSACSPGAILKKGTEASTTLIIRQLRTVNYLCAFQNLRPCMSYITNQSLNYHMLQYRILTN